MFPIKRLNNRNVHFLSAAGRCIDHIKPLDGATHLIRMHVNEVGWSVCPLSFTFRANVFTVRWPPTSRPLRGCIQPHWCHFPAEATQGRFTSPPLCREFDAAHLHRCAASNPALWPLLSPDDTNLLSRLQSHFTRTCWISFSKVGGGKKRKKRKQLSPWHLELPCKAKCKWLLAAC